MIRRLVESPTSTDCFKGGTLVSVLFPPVTLPLNVAICQVMNKYCLSVFCFHFVFMRKDGSWKLWPCRVHSQGGAQAAFSADDCPGRRPSEISSASTRIVLATAVSGRLTTARVASKMPCAFSCPVPREKVRRVTIGVSPKTHELGPAGIIQLKIEENSTFLYWNSVIVHKGNWDGLGTWKRSRKHRHYATLLSSWRKKSCCRFSACNNFQALLISYQILDFENIFVFKPNVQNCLRVIIRNWILLRKPWFQRSL